jgi:hypothetical protein
MASSSVLVMLFRERNESIADDSAAARV